ncbi:glycosyltransferase [Pseudoleptotrichia goodfellowii]|uniref:Glycosyltransferase, group 2 family protein n=1 Tax=Pseudoleptotrichia goodfellowii F0264 TaxID=596323 RepID=D0GI87_9FUSO|nr:glycosyltransferase [Pseudoleptotrichia goodfellowii]EEY36169.1 glycosyltransferase, group 2 family protein [Pseudoleptotrichia goodfellowii F0264]
MDLEITIPVFNEEETIKEKIPEMILYVKNNIKDIEISFIIVDNGSTDNTEKYSLELTKEYNNLKYIKLLEKGVGLALRTSWSQSQADYVGYMDLDIATDLEALETVVTEMKNGVKIINGSRLLKNSKVINRSFIREITSRVFNLLLKIILKVRFTDGMCGFKFLNRQTAQELIGTGIDTKGWFFSTEIMVKGYWKEIEIKEIPIKWTDDRKSKVKIFSLSWNYLKSIVKLKEEEKEFKK